MATLATIYAPIGRWAIPADRDPAELVPVVISTRQDVVTLWHDVSVDGCAAASFPTLAEAVAYIGDPDEDDDDETDDEPTCSDCGDTVRMLWNGNRCLDCHERALEFPHGRGEDYCGERWADD